ncbi:hypothetical protein [uncultured Mitsuokella sp.]|uniref:hypothetical protein n=1 Tax=uncultured Mitsuokella sp. TaxID=453120 RepID=UPI002617BEB6|nr:hypothetical protein [uncultured Mitsuokella sp.]
MLSILNYLRVRYVNQKAQGIVEYALLLALVVVVGAVLVGDNSIATYVKNIFSSVKDLLQNASTDATKKG